MTSVISNHPTSAHHELPSSSSTAVNMKRRQSLAEVEAEYVDGVCDKVFMHVVVSLVMFGFFAISASGVWQDRHDVIITAIVHLYSMVMVHLVIIRRRDDVRKRWELEACKTINTTGTELQTMLTSMLMLVATWIVLISLAVACFVFRPDWSDLAFIAFFVTLSTVLMFGLLGAEENSRNKMVKELCAKDASNGV